MKNILVIEDDVRMNEIICDYLETEGYYVLKAFDGNTGMDVFSKNSIDLVILDIMLPGLDGWSICRRMRTRSDVMIIILSARSDEEDKLLGFDLGADEYVTKPFSPKVLVARVNALMRRLNQEEKKNETSHLIVKGELQVDVERFLATVNGKDLRLTTKEFELLKIMAEQEKKVFTRQLLIEQIWGYDYIGDGRVVDTTIKTLRKKLGSLSVYIVTVIGVGYKFEVKES